MGVRGQRIRLGIADHHQLFVDLAQAWFEASGEFTVVFAVASASALRISSSEEKTDVCIVDAMLPDGDGMDLVQRLAAVEGAPKVVACANTHDTALVQRSIRAGAHGFVSKDMSLSQLSEAVRTVAAGKLYVSPEELRNILGNSDVRTELHDTLSRREFEVFMCIARGLSTKEIANRLFLDQRTVSTYKRHVLDKMKFERVSELVTYALRRGLVD